MADVSVDSERPDPGPSETPPWIKRLIGEAPLEMRVAVASAVGMSVLFLLLVGLMAILAIFGGPNSGRMLDILQSLLAGLAGGGASGGLVARQTRRARPAQPAA